MTDKPDRRLSAGGHAGIVLVTRMRLAKRFRALLTLAIPATAVAILFFPKRIEGPSYAGEMKAVKAITTIHTAETQYYARYGGYATTLAQLGPNGAELIDGDLASGNKAGFRFVLSPTPAGYALVVSPAAFGTSGAHAYYSDQDTTIHQHNGKEPGTRNDPLLGDPVPPAADVD